jgi:NAD(P) transhydrogenase subunit beta
MSRTVYDLIGLAAGIAFILALKGLSHPKTARRGNLIGAFGAGLATLVVFFYSNENSSLPLNNLGWILGAIAIGLVCHNLLHYLMVWVVAQQRSWQLLNT